MRGPFLGLRTLPGPRRDTIAYRRGPGPCVPHEMLPRKGLLLLQPLNNRVSRNDLHLLPS